MAKKPFIVIFHFVLFLLAIITSILALTDHRKYELTIQFLGKPDAVFDYLMDSVLLAISILLVYGYIKAKKWAFKMTFCYYILYFIGLFIGLYLLITRYEEFIKFATMIRYGKEREMPFTFKTSILLAMLSITIKFVFAYFALRYLKRNKNYFKN